MRITINDDWLCLDLCSKCSHLHALFDTSEGECKVSGGIISILLCLYLFS